MNNPHVDYPPVDYLPIAPRYIIWGDPAALIRLRSRATKIFDNQRHKRTCCIIDLEEQHYPRKLYSGTIHLIIDFFFNKHYGLSTRALQNRRACNRRAYSRPVKNAPSIGFYDSYPSIAQLIKLVENLGKNVIFSNSYKIISVTATKYMMDTQRPKIVFEVHNVQVHNAQGYNTQVDNV